MRQLIRKIAPLRRLYYRMSAHAQSNEAAILAELAKDAPRYFVEFGFHPAEFNCCRLSGWSGLLIDGNQQQVDDANAILPDGVHAVCRFLTLENIEFIRNHFTSIGVLSIDVDGNDYWFLKALIDTAPEVICVEYNSTLGHDAVTVPYDPAFHRMQKHPKGWYHGASLAALSNLCALHGYGLAAIADSGCNAFFTREGTLDPKAAWRPNKFRADFSGIPHEQQQRAIKGLPLVSV